MLAHSHSRCAVIRYQSRSAARVNVGVPNQQHLVTRKCETVLDMVGEDILSICM